MGLIAGYSISLRKFTVNCSRCQKAINEHRPFLAIPRRQLESIRNDVLNFECPNYLTGGNGPWTVNRGFKESLVYVCIA